MNPKDIIAKAKERRLLGDNQQLAALTKGIVSDILQSIIPELNAKVEEAIVQMRSIRKGDDGKEGRKGEPGKRGPQGLRGEKGEKGDKGDKPIAGIDYPIPKDGKIDENKVITNVLGKIPKPKDGKDGSPDTPLQIADKLNTLEEKVDMKVIRGLERAIQVLERNIREKKQEHGGGSGGMGNWITEAPAGSIDNTNMTFTITNRVAGGGKAIILLYNGQVQEYGNHFTVSNKTITMTFAPEGDTSLFAMYVRA